MNTRLPLKIFLISFFILLEVQSIVAQPIPVGDVRETQLRFRQLLGDSTVPYSFMLRPMWIPESAPYALGVDDLTLRRELKFEEAKKRALRLRWWREPTPKPEKDPLRKFSSIYYPQLIQGDSLTFVEVTLRDFSYWSTPANFFETPITLPKTDPETDRFSRYLQQNVRFGLYDLETAVSYNRDLPYGDNDGAAWAGVGINQRYQGGFYITAPFFTLSLRPQFSSAQNLDFLAPRFVPENPFNKEPTYSQEGEFILEDWLAERIDAPYRFGPDAFSTFDWGHSSIRFHYKEFEIGASTENVWWGPGIRYTLAMSNNAAGVPHFFLGTRSPYKLPGKKTGNLEFQWLLGFPERSEYHDFSWSLRFRPLELEELENYYRQRFLNGLHLVYSPGFLPGLHLSYTRYAQQYIEDAQLRFKDVTRVFRRFPRPDWDAVYSDYWKDQSYYEDYNTASMVGLRMVFPEAHAEFFIEFHKESVHKDFHDFLMESQHDRSYNVGAQILTPFYNRSRLEFSRLRVEFTNLVPTRLDDTRPQSFTYAHNGVKQGHTHLGQLLGAGLGVGSDSQFINYEFYFPNYMVGLILQRLAINDQYHYELNKRYLPGLAYKDYKHMWTMLNIGIVQAYRTGNTEFAFQLHWMKHFNYGRIIVERFSTFDPDDKFDMTNLNAELRIRYLF